MAERSTARGWRDLPIGVRIGTGFSVVLLLLVAVAVVGWFALGAVATGAAVSDRAGRLIQHMATLRVAQESFVRTHAPDDAARVRDLMTTLHGDAEALAGAVDGAGAEGLAEVNSALADFDAAFTQFGELQARKDQALTEMVAAAGNMEKAAQAIRANQHQVFASLRQGTELLQSSRDDKLSLADIANELIRLALEARLAEKDFLRTGDLESVARARALMDEIAALAGDLESRFAIAGDKARAAEVQSAARAYGAALDALVPLTEERRDLAEERREILDAVDEHARAAGVAAVKIQSDMNLELQNLRGSADTTRADLDQAVARAEQAKAMIDWLEKATRAIQDYVAAPGPKPAQAVTEWTDRVIETSQTMFRTFRNIQNKALAASTLRMAKMLGRDFADLKAVTEEMATLASDIETQTAALLETSRHLETVAGAIQGNQRGELTALNARVREAADERARYMEILDGATTLLLEVRRARQAERTFLVDGDEAHAETARAAIEAVIAGAGALTEQVTRPGARQQTAALAEAARAYLEGLATVVATTNQQALTQRAMAIAADVVADRAQSVGDDIRDSIDRDVGVARLVLGIGALTALALGIVLAFVIGRGISRPIRAMTSAMARLAGDDLGTEVPARNRRDELGAMAGAVQVFKDNMVHNRELAAQNARDQAARTARAERIQTLAAEFDRSVGGSLDTVAESAGQLQDTAQGLNRTAGQVTERAAAVATATGQAGANVEAVAAAAEELASSIQEISRQVQHQAHIADTAATAAQDSESQVRTLAEAAQRIGEVVGLITDIAEQTNLLALNATIEAARAGEAGKGFAVVANEVKSLANQTSRATEDIAAQIKAIQEQTGTTVRAIEDITSRIRDMNEISASVASAVEQQNAATGEIGRNAQEAATGTGEVSRNINGVSDGAARVDTAASEVQAEADGVARQTEDLRRVIQGFLNDVKSA